MASDRELLRISIGEDGNLFYIPAKDATTCEKLAAAHFAVHCVNHVMKITDRLPHKQQSEVLATREES